MFDKLCDFDPVVWVNAFESMSGFSKGAFWTFVIAIAAWIGGDGISKIVRAVRGA